MTKSCTGFSNGKTHTFVLHAPSSGSEVDSVVLQYHFPVDDEDLAQLEADQAGWIKNHVQQDYLDQPDSNVQVEVKDSTVYLNLSTDPLLEDKNTSLEKLVRGFETEGYICS